jgi:hypothetical protein
VSNDQMRNEILSAGPDDGDWTDVLRRTKRARRRQGVYGFVLLTALVVVGVASAYALGHPVIDFGKAAKGPKKVVNDFGSMEVGAPPGMAPGVLPHQTRRIMSFRVDGKNHVLWVAPTNKGGFCADWSELGGGCRANRHDRSAGELDVMGSGETIDSSDGKVVTDRVLFGSFFNRNGARLEITYADGKTTEISFVWVSKPIKAGFYYFPVPNLRRHSGRWPVVVTLFDSDGKRLTHESIRHGAPSILNLVPRRLPGYLTLSVPAKAIWSKRRQLFDLRADDGARVGLWIAPKRGGGTCVWTTQSFGCSVPGQVEKTPVLAALGTFGGGFHVTLGDRVGASVARVEARFEGGDKVELVPKEGYLIWPIPSRYYPRGHRLEELVAYDESGRVLARKGMHPNFPSLYPCAKPKRYRYGVRMCP